MILISIQIDKVNHFKIMINEYILWLKNYLVLSFICNKIDLEITYIGQRGKKKYIIEIVGNEKLYPK